MTFSRKLAAGVRITGSCGDRRYSDGNRHGQSRRLYAGTPGTRVNAVCRAEYLRRVPDEKIIYAEDRKWGRLYA